MPPSQSHNIPKNTPEMQSKYSGADPERSRRLNLHELRVGSEQIKY